MQPRRARMVIGIGAALATILPLALAQYAHGRASHDLGARLTQLTGLPSRIGGVDAGLTGTVRLTDVAIGDLFAARAIEARVALPTLLAGELSADEIQVEAPRLRAHVAGDDIDLVRVVRRIVARPGAVPSHGSRRAIKRIVVTEGDLVVEIAGAGTIAAAEVELHPQPGGVRVVTGPIRIRHPLARATFARAAADVALPGVRVVRLLAAGGSAVVQGPGGPPLAIAAASVTRSFDGPVLARGDVDDAGVPRPIQIALERDAVAVTLDHVPLGAAAPWLPAPIDVRDARLTGNIDLARAPSGAVALVANGELAGAALASPTVADAPIPVAVTGEVTARWHAGVLDLFADLATGKVRARGEAHLEASGGPGLAVAGFDRGRVALAIPATPCLDLLDALPAAVRGATAGLTVEGEAAAHLEIALVGGADLGEAIRIAADVDVARCRVLAEAPAGDPTALRGEREHVFLDGSRARIGPDRPGWAALDDLPAHVPGAFVAAEDARFWQHRGFDVEQIARSLEIDLREGRLARGGSTISQQLVKNAFLGPERTFARKLQEAILTWRLEATTKKRPILELYLNVIELGPGVFGVTAAAQHWFGKPADALTVREAAFLAALTPEPRSMAARVAAARGLDARSAERVDVVLRAMKRGGVIDADRHDTARAAGLAFRRGVLAPGP